MIKIAKRELTGYGREVKKRLLDRGMTQAAFCRRYRINPQMFSDMLYTDRFPKFRRHVARLLDMRGPIP